MSVSGHYLFKAADGFPRAKFQDNCDVFRVTLAEIGGYPVL